MAATMVVLSGGLDSATLLFHQRAMGDAVSAISINYGQRHARELDAAAAICQRDGIPHRVADLRAMRDLFGHNALSDQSIPVPEGHYQAESMKLTVVPNRNMILLSVAIAWAISSKCERVAYGAHAGDHAIYPDCRPEFADAMADAARLADWQPIELLRPFVNWTKTDIVRRAHDLAVPLELTWSCYNGGAVHCGVCGTCVERREAFREAGVNDPTIYARGPGV
jgi:7-cyano-7-deazaguanine synthase